MKYPKASPSRRLSRIVFVLALLLPSVVSPETTDVASAQTVLPTTAAAVMATAASSSEVTLEWNASTDSGGPGLYGYQIYRNGTFVGTSLVTEFVDTGLLPNTQYCYGVVAVDMHGDAASTSAEACVTTPPAPSPTYYVDYAEGSDANAGTSPATAWQHCPGDFYATGVAGSTALNPGDTVIFKGGVRYVLEDVGIDLNWSGTAEQPITYDGNSAGTWGEGNAILVGSTTHFINPFVRVRGASNIAFTQSIFVGLVGGATANGNSYVLNFGAACSNGAAATDTYMEQTNADGSPNLYNGNPWFMGSSSGFSLAYEMITNSLGTNMYVIEAGSPPSPTNTVLFYTQSD